VRLSCPAAGSQGFYDVPVILDSIYVVVPVGSGKLDGTDFYTGQQFDDASIALSDYFPYRGYDGLAVHREQWFVHIIAGDGDDRIAAVGELQ
jgi:hypothetical protein